MQTDILILFIGELAVLLIVQDRMTEMIRRFLDTGSKGSKNTILGTLVKGTLCFASFTAGLSEPAFLMLLLPPFFYDYLNLWKKFRVPAVFCAATFYTLFVVFFLSAQSICSIFTGRDLKWIFEDPVYFLSILIFSTAATCLHVYLQIRVCTYDKVMILFTDDRRLWQLTVFSLYGVFYVLFDSIACSYQFPYMLVAWFVLGSSLLLLIQLYLFVIHTYRIILNSHYEEEYYRLEDARDAQIREELKLANLAIQDSLTGTRTRRYTMEFMDSILKEREPFVIAFIDLDHLKEVNDLYNHAEGDKYLVKTAWILNNSFEKKDMLGRIGGDEFLILCPGREEAEVEELLKKANDRLKSLSPKEIVLSFSYGVLKVEKGGTKTAKELIHEADLRMYACKSSKREDIL